MSIVSFATSGSTPAQVLATATDWRTAAGDLISWLISQDRCFSSGEIAAYIRQYRTDFSFSVPNLGSWIRDQFDNGLFPSYQIQGVDVYPSQVPRITTGVAVTLDGRTGMSKTPAGVNVFVYAPDATQGQSHDFEIFIPDWDDPNASRIVSCAPVAQGTPAPVFTPRLAPADLTATVRQDRRLCLPRAAFDALMGVCGCTLRGGPNGDPVYITFENGGDSVRITTAAVDSTSTTHYLWANRGRMAFLNAGMPFVPGDKYRITLDNTSLVVDLTTKV